MPHCLDKDKDCVEHQGGRPGERQLRGANWPSPIRVGRQRHAQRDMSQLDYAASTGAVFFVFLSTCSTTAWAVRFEDAPFCPVTKLPSTTTTSVCF